MGKGLNEQRLKIGLLVFFLALAIPAVLLVIRAYDQVKWEVFHQYRVLAEELSQRIDTDMRRMIEAEEVRSFADYSFLVVAGDPKSNLIQRSRLSNYPVDSEIPGLVGYFQVDSAGALSSPVLPELESNYRDYGISDNELTDRKAVKDRVHAILNRPAAVSERRADEAGAALQAKVELELDFADAPVAQNEAPRESSNVFDRLSSVGKGQSKRQILRGYGRVEDLKLDSRLEKKSREQSRAKQSAIARDLGAGKRASRKEQIAVYESAQAPDSAYSDDDAMLAEIGASSHEVEEKLEEIIAPAAILQQPTSRMRFFESEIDPMTFDVLDDPHFVIFRNVWREGERYIQGAVIERAAFIASTIGAVYQSATLSSMSNLLTAYQGDVLTAYSAEQGDTYLSRSSDLQGELLYRTRLSSPLSGLELIYSVTELPLGPSVRYLAWVAFALIAVLIGGCYAIYRFGVGQMNLYRQQQDFISAVSHELKTPLTSIRMYSEMLKAGWAEEDKKASYYAFIHDESERLSRLIANVLQLARMTRGHHQIEPKPMKVNELMERTTPKLSSQLQSAGFELDKDFHPDALDATIAIDDAFTQILINLVDNAIKFSPGDAEKRIDLKCSRQSDGRLCVTVRDYGPGIMKDQMRKIFELFYRSENELTWETVGTGIGLALVHQLTTAMNGKIDVRNRDPGAEFSLTFPVHERSSD